MAARKKCFRPVQSDPSGGPRLSPQPWEGGLTTPQSTRPTARHSFRRRQEEPMAARRNCVRPARFGLKRRPTPHSAAVGCRADGVVLHLTDCPPLFQQKAGRTDGGTQELSLIHI